MTRYGEQVELEVPVQVSNNLLRPTARARISASSAAAKPISLTPNHIVPKTPKGLSNFLIEHLVKHEQRSRVMHVLAQSQYVQ